MSSPTTQHIEKQSTHLQVFRFRDEEKQIVLPIPGTIITRTTLDTGERQPFVVVVTKKKKQGKNEGIIDTAILYPIDYIEGNEIHYYMRDLLTLKLTNHGNWWTTRSESTYRHEWDIFYPPIIQDGGRKRTPILLFARIISKVKR